MANEKKPTHPHLERAPIRKEERTDRREPGAEAPSTDRTPEVSQHGTKDSSPVPPAPKK